LHGALRDDRDGNGREGGPSRCGFRSSKRRRHLHQGQGRTQLVYHPDRLNFPLQRTRPKGDPDAGWQRISWDEALDGIAARLNSIRETYGPRAVALAKGTGGGTSVSDAERWSQASLTRSLVKKNWYYVPGILPGWLFPCCHHAKQIADAIGISPFVIVPTEALEIPVASNISKSRVKNGRMRIPDNVGGYYG
jgi:Molybdopterin oxidoreductase